MQAVILAGGLATRMQPRTLTMPKSLLPVSRRPFVFWQLERIQRSGFSRALLLIGHLGHEIRAAVGDGSRFGLRVEYSEDGPTLLGTGGAVRRALALLEPEFLVTYGDSYLPFDYSAPLRDLLAHPEALGTMSVFENRGRWDQSNTEIKGDWVTRYDKGRDDPTLDHIDYGAIALRRELFEQRQEGAVFGVDEIQQQLAVAGKLRAYSAPRRFYEIGSEAGLEELDSVIGELDKEGIEP